MMQILGDLGALVVMMLLAPLLFGTLAVAAFALIVGAIAYLLSSWLGRLVLGAWEYLTDASGHDGSPDA